MKTYALLPVIVALLVALGVLVWMNRGSEKVVTAGFTGVLLVGAAVVSLLLFTRQAPVAVSFPASFIVRQATLMPATLDATFFGRYANAFVAPGQLARAKPELFKGTWGEPGMTRYHDLLEWAILDTLQMVFKSTWQPDISIYKLPGLRGRSSGPPEGSAPPKQIAIGPDQLRRALLDNPFVDVPHNMSQSIVAPPGTVLAREHKEHKATRALVLRNPYCAVRIETQDLMGHVGAPPYLAFAGLTAEAGQGQYATLTYRVRIFATFDVLRTGAPDMPLYRRWVEQIASVLQDDFDEQGIFRRVVEHQELLKLTGGVQ